MKNHFFTTTILSCLTIGMLLAGTVSKGETIVSDQIKLMAGTWTLSTKGTHVPKGGDVAAFTQTITLNFLKDAGDGSNFITGKTFGNEIVKSSIPTAQRNGKVSFKTSYRIKAKYSEISWEGTLDATATQITDGKFATPSASGSFTALKN